MTRKNNDYKWAYGTIHVPPSISKDVIDELRKLGVVEVMSNDRIKFTEQFKQRFNADDADLKLFMDINTATGKHLQSINHPLYNDDRFMEMVLDIYNLHRLIRATDTFRSNELIDTLKASSKPDKLLKMR